MPFTVTPISEDEVGGSGGLWAEGFYDFHIIDAEETKSKAGNDMVVIDLKFQDGGKTRELKDYLVSMASTQWKIRSFYDAIGRVSDYESGIIDATKLIGASGRAKIVHEKYEKQDGTDGLAHKVGEYQKGGAVKPIPNPKVKPDAPLAEEEDDGDSIPF